MNNIAQHMADKYKAAEQVAQTINRHDGFGAEIILSLFDHLGIDVDDDQLLDALRCVVNEYDLD